MRREDIDYVSPATKHSVSLLVALGYEVEPRRRCKNTMDDTFYITEEGVHIPCHDEVKNEDVPLLRRRDFFRFACSRHDTLRRCKRERKIDGYVD